MFITQGYETWKPGGTACTCGNSFNNAHYEPCLRFNDSQKCALKPQIVHSDTHISKVRFCISIHKRSYDFHLENPWQNPAMLHQSASSFYASIMTYVSIFMVWETYGYWKWNNFKYKSTSFDTNNWPYSAYRVENFPLRNKNHELSICFYILNMS